MIGESRPVGETGSIDETGTTRDETETGDDTEIGDNNGTGLETGTSGELETRDGLLKETGTGDSGSGCKNDCLKENRLTDSCHDCQVRQDIWGKADPTAWIRMAV